MSRTSWLNGLLALFFFLLPWQTRWIFSQATIAGEAFSLGSMSLYLTEAVLLLALLGWMGVTTKSIRTSVGSLMGGFFAAAAVSILFAMNHDVAWTQLMHIAFAGALFFLLVDKRVDLSLMAKAFVVGLIIPVILGLVQLFGGSSGASTLLGLAVRDAQTLGDAVTVIGGERFLRAYGSFPHPNIFGGYLAVGLLSILYLWQQVKDQKERWLLGAGAVVLAVGLAATFSRSAWLGLVVGVFAAGGVLMSFGKPIGKYRGVIAFASAFMIVLVIAGLMSGRFDPSTYVESASITERVEQYQDFPLVMEERDWLFGNGLGNYVFAVEAYDGSREWWQYQPIHNVPLLMIGEIGLIGFVLFVLFAARLDIINFSRFPNTDALIAFAMGNVVLVVLLFDHYPWTTWSGLALAAYVLAYTLRLGEHETDRLV